MKYLIGIIISALIIGGMLTISVYYTLGEDPGYFFAKLIAAPMGLLGAGFCFVVYDTLWPKKKVQPGKKRHEKQQVNRVHPQEP